MFRKTFAVKKFRVYKSAKENRNSVNVFFTLILFIKQPLIMTANFIVVLIFNVMSVYIYVSSKKNT